MIFSNAFAIPHRTRGDPVKKMVGLHIEVEVELPRVGAETDSVDLCPFVLDPDIDDIRREYAAFEQELVVCFQGIDGLFE